MNVNVKRLGYEIKRIQYVKTETLQWGQESLKTKLVRELGRKSPQ
jgi:hypothetical protein